jgi:hypothetical protein
VRQSSLRYPIALLIFTGVVFATVARPLGAGPAPGDTVPGGVSLPHEWQATVQQDPPGPASLLIGGDSIGFQGTDIYDSEGKVAAVGRSGDYRMLLYSGWNEVPTGTEVLLSPDGRHVAQEFLEGSTAAGGTGMDIVDLTSGRSVQYDGGLPPAYDGMGDGELPACCVPVAWAPDGRSLLVEAQGGYTPDERNSAISERTRRLGLLDLATDTVVPLGEEHPADAIRRASRGAFAPDGEHLVVTDSSGVRLIDRTGKSLWTTALSDRQALAGSGAFSADGARVAIAELDGCLDRCDGAALAARRWSISYLDAATGKPVGGPVLPGVTAMSIRAVGWTAGGDLVVTRHEPEPDAVKEPGQVWDDTGWAETRHLTLVALGADGTVRTLLDPPGDVGTMDVAADLVRAGRFGGPAPAAAAFPARGIIWVTVGWSVFLAAVLLLILWLLSRVWLSWRRRLTRG